MKKTVLFVFFILSFLFSFNLASAISLTVEVKDTHENDLSDKIPISPSAGTHTYSEGTSVEIHVGWVEGYALHLIEVDESLRIEGTDTINITFYSDHAHVTWFSGSRDLSGSDHKVIAYFSTEDFNRYPYRKPTLTIKINKEILILKSTKRKSR